jgi:hypothetical protein
MAHNQVSASPEFVLATIAKAMFVRAMFALANNICPLGVGQASPWNKKFGCRAKR